MPPVGRVWRSRKARVAISCAQNESSQEVGKSSTLDLEIVGVFPIGVGREEIPEVVLLLKMGFKDGQLSHPRNGIAQKRVPDRVEFVGQFLRYQFAQGMIEYAEIPADGGGRRGQTSKVRGAEGVKRQKS